MMLPLIFMSSRQKKAQRQQQERVAALGIGDEVRTHSGFYGLIVDEFDDLVILESESGARITRDRKSTRLNSSHVATSYAVFCLKKKTTRAGGTATGAAK